MDYPCSKFGDYNSSLFWFYRANRQADKIAYRITDEDDRYTHATPVCVSNKHAC